MISGALDALMELLPRIVVELFEPSALEPYSSTFRPGTDPCSTDTRFGAGRSSIRSLLNEATAPVTSLFFWTPYPTTTISSSTSLSTSIRMLIRLREFTGTDWVAIPIHV